VPSQKQLRWSQLKVGLTVIVAAIVLGILIFLMSGTGGFFAKKIILRAYFDNAGGLLGGAPVRLEGVDIGNVSNIRVVSDPNRRLAPVEVTMKITTKYLANVRTDSLAMLSTAGVLGSTYVDIESRDATGPVVQSGQELRTIVQPEISDVVRSTQGTLQNLDALLKRLDRIVAFVESGQGSIGKLIYDPGFYNRLNATLNEFQTIASDVSGGKGSLGKVVASDELYQKANTAVDKLNSIIDELQQGKGTAGRFLKDPALYDNANQTVANIRKFTDDVNAGKGVLGKMTHDEELAAKLRDTINKLSAITNDLQAGQGTAGMFLKDPRVYTNTDQLLVETRSLIKAIRENPKRYLTIHFKLF
jgi:phospholipid/cholesterol/gamma-HCH transport system substrate-binding protein